VIREKTMQGDYVCVILSKPNKVKELLGPFDTLELAVEIGERRCPSDCGYDVWQLSEADDADPVFPPG
jgi:hypothetical protein